MKGNARNALKAAHVDVAKLTATVQQLEESLARSNEITAAGANAMEIYSRLDNGISRWRADAVKSGKDPRNLPPELKAQVKAREEAKEELRQSEDTSGVIEAELNDAKVRLQRMQGDIASLAAAVLREHANGLGTELMALEQRRWELRQVLGAMAGTKAYIDGLGWVEIGVSTETAAAVGGYSPGEFAGSVDPFTDLVNAWGARFKALLANAEAPIEALLPIRPRDYTWNAAGRPVPPAR
jgi:hypothetical protein